MDAQIAEAVATQLAKVGVKVKIQRWEWAAYQTNTRKTPEEAKYDMFLLGWAPSTGDADWAIRPLLYSAEWMPVGDNRSYYKNADADALIKQGMETSDQSKRKEIYKKAQEVLVEDGAWLMLHDMVQSVGVSNKLNNVAVWPIEIVLVKDASWSN
jgi:ABC-type transport system substrate-binding protein